VPDPSVQPPEGLRKIIAEAEGARRNGVASDGRGWFRTDADRMDCYAVADAVLAALFDACEVREQFGVRAEGVDDFWPYEPTREWAEKAIASRAKRNWPASHLIRRCDLRTPPESVVSYPEKPRGR
jgi:hypothetical protein